jgi:hypothetical protein
MGMCSGGLTGGPALRFCMFCVMTEMHLHALSMKAQDQSHPAAAGQSAEEAVPTTPGVVPKDLLTKLAVAGFGTKLAVAGIPEGIALMQQMHSVVYNGE